jgi:hypothetical protein
MKWLNDYRLRLVLVGIVAGIVVGVGRARADFTFGDPVNLGATINGSSADTFDSLSADGLEMYITSNRSGSYGDWDIWVSTRETIDDEWMPPVNLGPTINATGETIFAFLSSDDLELYYASWGRAGGYGREDIWVTKRATKYDPWSQPTNLGPVVNSSSNDWSPSISPDGLELYFTSQRSGGYGSHDIWVSRRPTKNEPWEPPVNLGPSVNSSAYEGPVFLSSDGLVLFFSGNLDQPTRPGGYGDVDMWMTKRTSISDPWGTPVNLGPMVNSPSLDCCPRISPDGSTLYFCSTRPGGFGGEYGDIYQAPIIPIVDFNADGIVDSTDMCIMVDNWGTDEPLCDIGPMPWGDGIVDVEDLKVLAEYLFGDTQSVAHFKLDESKGSIANDSARNLDGTVHGNPIWLPTGGVIGGALQLDGLDDYIKTGFVVNPAKGELSVFVWIKGGAPGQVVLSQISGVNWLCADTSEGFLMTELKASGRAGKALQSQTLITDGNWHRIGFVWDGSNRTLYVDDVLIAQDTQLSLEGSNNGLYIGCGKNMEPGTYWSGLIDDVRIYNRAVIP